MAFESNTMQNSDRIRQGFEALGNGFSGSGGNLAEVQLQRQRLSQMLQQQQLENQYRVELSQLLQKTMARDPQTGRVSFAPQSPQDTGRIMALYQAINPSAQPKDILGALNDLPDKVLNQQYSVTNKGLDPLKPGDSVVASALPSGYGQNYDPKTGAPMLSPKAPSQIQPNMAVPALTAQTEIAKQGMQNQNAQQINQQNINQQNNTPIKVSPGETVIPNPNSIVPPSTTNPPSQPSTFIPSGNGFGTNKMILPQGMMERMNGQEQDLNKLNSLSDLLKSNPGAMTPLKQWEMNNLPTYFAKKLVPQPDQDVYNRLNNLGISLGVDTGGVVGERSPQFRDLLNKQRPSATIDLPSNLTAIESMRQAILNDNDVSKKMYGPQYTLPPITTHDSLNQGQQSSSNPTVSGAFGGTSTSPQDDLMTQAQKAIAAGADPAAVHARIQSLQGSNQNPSVSPAPQSTQLMSTQPPLPSP